MENIHGTITLGCSLLDEVHAIQHTTSPLVKSGVFIPFWIWINYADSDLIWSPTNTGILPRRGYGYNPVRGLLGVYNFARVLLVALPVVTKGSLTCMHYSLHTRDLRIYRPSPIGLGTYLILPLKDLTGGSGKVPTIINTMTRLPRPGIEH